MMSEEPERAARREALEERLLEYAAACIRIAELLPASYAGRHVCGQLIRSGTAPIAQHGEAQSAESTEDFVHKMAVALKELRESERWLRLIVRVPLLKETAQVTTSILESDELQRIFFASIQTARQRPKHRPS